MAEDTLLQFDDIGKSVRNILYAINCPEHMLLDLDSTLFGTYGNHEGEDFNFYYQVYGYHPLFYYDGLTEDLLKAQLCKGTLHCSNDADKFMDPLFRNTWKEALIHTFVVTADSHLTNFIKLVR